ncbi:hypothetical protein pdam_00016555 [Pocillopora damicornis]|uniref:Uncharacterized protein n=1 Tax=Pocillopora damicornis TaxID=46731 RepID=A0A3M6TFN6_POCDA|nr:hypothetical protein pdam_00016555 [Pocillopora damicornis]
MDRVYVYNKVRSLLAVFVAFEVLNGEDKKPGRGKTRQWIRRRDEKGYFNNIVKELAIEDTAKYKEMMQMKLLLVWPESAFWHQEEVVLLFKSHFNHVAFLAASKREMTASNNTSFGQLEEELLLEDCSLLSAILLIAHGTVVDKTGFTHNFHAFECMASKLKLEDQVSEEDISLPMDKLDHRELMVSVQSCLLEQVKIERVVGDFPPRKASVFPCFQLHLSLHSYSPALARPSTLGKVYNHNGAQYQQEVLPGLV